MSDRYDFANWKPADPQKLLQAIGEASETADEPTALQLTTDRLPERRLRISIWATVKDDDPSEDKIEPYLSILFEEDTGKALGFIRTDVYLAH